LFKFQLGGYVKKLISVQDLTYSIPYGQNILKDISFDLHAGEFLGVLGRNGVGKTTLIDLLLGLRLHTSGTIDILGESPMAPDRKNTNAICYLSHDANLKGNISVAQYLKFYAGFFPSYSLEQEKKLLEYFSLNLTDRVGGLSTGQQKKVQAVGALSSMPKLLFIDEMTAVLDPETRSQLFKVLHLFKVEHGLGIILATNIAEDLINRADKILFINDCKGSLQNPSDILELFNVEKAS
jgi:ABC-2 type transport system ATP-binding protein